MDSVAKEFSRYFYTNLLNGLSIEEAFERAKDSITQNQG